MKMNKHTLLSTVHWHIHTDTYVVGNHSPKKRMYCPKNLKQDVIRATVPPQKNQYLYSQGHNKKMRQRHNKNQEKQKTKREKQLILRHRSSVTALP